MLHWKRGEFRHALKKELPMNIRIATALVALLFAAVSSLAESYYIVTTTDLLGEKTFSVKTAQQLKEETAVVRARASALPKVLAKMLKEWKANPEEHVGKFHGGKMKAPTIKSQGPISDFQKAQQKADKLTERASGVEDEPSKKKKSKAEKEKEYEEAMKKQEIVKFSEDVDKAIDEFLKEKESAPKKKNY